MNKNTESQKQSLAMVKVSIIIPVYNVENYLEKCLDSVLNQTMSEIEVICVDDGSTDRSTEILKKYARKDRRLHVIFQKNKGVSVARNRALANAVGEYVIFVDSDDYIEETLCEEIYKLITSKEGDIAVYGGYVFAEEETENDYLKGAFAFFENNLNTEDYIVNDDSVNALTVRRGSFPLIWNKMYKREIVIECGGFEEGLALGEDEAFLFAVFPLAENILYTSKKYYHYLRNRKNSATDKIVMDYKKRAEENLKVAKTVKNKWDELGILEVHEKEYLDRYVELLFDSVKLVDYSPKFQEKYTREFMSYFLENFSGFAKYIMDIWIRRTDLMVTLDQKEGWIKHQYDEIQGLINEKNKLETQNATLREALQAINHVVIQNQIPQIVPKEQLRSKKERKVKEQKVKQPRQVQKLKINKKPKNVFLKNIDIIFGQVEGKGYATYIRLKKLYGDDCTFVSCAFAGLGDAYLICGYLPEWLKKNNISSYRFLMVGKAERNMVEGLFPEIGRNCVMITQEEHEWLRNMDRCCDGTSDFYFFHHYDYMQMHLMITEHLQGYNGISMTDLYLWKMGLPLDTPFMLPQKVDAKTKEVTELLRERKLKEKKTVIISPYSTCLGKLNDRFWRPIIMAFKKEGYSVCTNCGSADQKPLPGTEEIYVSFEKLLEFVERCGFFVGIRSGLCDVISSANCKMAVVHPYDSAQWGEGNGIKYVGLSNMKMRTDVKEFELESDNKNIQDIQKGIVHFFSKDS